MSVSELAFGRWIGPHTRCSRHVPVVFVACRTTIVVVRPLIVGQVRSECCTRRNRGVMRGVAAHEVKSSPLLYCSSKRRASAGTGSTAIVTTGKAAQLSMIQEESDPPIRFSAEEIQGIREALGSTGEPVTCPACGGELKVGGVASLSLSMPVFRRVECVPCRRAAIVVSSRWVGPGARWTGVVLLLLHRLRVLCRLGLFR